MTPRWIWLSVASVGLVTTLSAQTKRPAFEVASVKKRTEPLRLTSFANPNVVRGNALSMPSTTVFYLVQFGYDIRDYQVVEGPDAAEVLDA